MYSFLVPSVSGDFEKQVLEHQRDIFPRLFIVTTYRHERIPIIFLTKTWRPRSFVVNPSLYS